MSDVAEKDKLKQEIYRLTKEVERLDAENQQLKAALRRAIGDQCIEGYIKRISADRDQRYANRPFRMTENPHEVGMHVEFAVAELCGVFPDVMRREHGDGDIDLCIPMLVRTGCTGRRHFKIKNYSEDEAYVGVREGKAEKCQLWVFGVWNDDGDGTTEIIGALTREQVMSFKVKDLPGGYPGHQIPISTVRKIGMSKEQLACKVARLQTRELLRERGWR